MSWTPRRAFWPRTVHDEGLRAWSRSLHGGLACCNLAMRKLGGYANYAYSGAAVCASARLEQHPRWLRAWQLLSAVMTGIYKNSGNFQECPRCTRVAMLEYARPHLGVMQFKLGAKGGRVSSWCKSARRIAQAARATHTLQYATQLRWADTICEAVPPCRKTGRAAAWIATVKDGLGSSARVFGPGQVQAGSTDKEQRKAGTKLSQSKLGAKGERGQVLV